MLVIRHDVHIYNEPTPGQQQQLDRIEAVVNQISEGVIKMGKELDDLETAVAAETTVDDSVLALVTTLVDKVEALKNDPRRLQSLLDQVRSNTAKLQGAVTANTPADPGTGDSTGDTGGGTTDTGGTTGDGTGATGDGTGATS